jgi:hypothetical protein
MIMVVWKRNSYADTPFNFATLFNYSSAADFAG